MPGGKSRTDCHPKRNASQDHKITFVKITNVAKMAGNYSVSLCTKGHDLGVSGCSASRGTSTRKRGTELSATFRVAESMHGRNSCQGVFMPAVDRCLAGARKPSKY